MNTAIFSHNLSRQICLLACIAILSACMSTPTASRVNRIQIIAFPDANQMTATAVDIVFVYDKNVEAMMPKSSTQWFDTKAALTAGLATAIQVVSLKIPPATDVNVTMPANHSKAIAVLCFSNYLNSEGQVVGNITSFRDVTILLSSGNVVYQDR